MWLGMTLNTRVPIREIRFQDRTGGVVSFQEDQLIGRIFLGHFWTTFAIEDGDSQLHRVSS